MRTSVCAAVIAAATILLAPPARAEDGDDERARAVTARACNKTDARIFVALGRTELSGGEERRYSEGWWYIDAGRCQTLRTDLKGGIYLYAETEDGYRRWIPDEGHGSARFCINTEDHFDYDEGDCDPPGANMRKQRFGRVVDSNDDGFALYNFR